MNRSNHKIIAFEMGEILFPILNTAPPNFKERFRILFLEGPICISIKGVDYKITLENYEKKPLTQLFLQAGLLRNRSLSRK